MILKISRNVFIGDLEGLIFTDKSWAIIHASQKYHYYVMGWDFKDNKPDKNHSNYLFYKYKDEISLNWVDGDKHLYDWVGTETFTELLDFIEEKSEKKRVFVHCDKGESRSPTIGLLYLAKRTNEIPSKNFYDAYRKYIKIYPQYKPGGIAEYVSDNWNKIT